MRVRWVDVDLERGFLRIPSNKRHRTKSGKGRSVPLTPRLEAALREHFAAFRLASYDGTRPEYVFHYHLARGRQEPGAVKKAMGHSDLRTTMAYTHLLPDHLRALVEGGPQEERRSSGA